MPDTRSYNNCLKEMFGLRRFGIKLGLSTIRNILKKLGNPQKHFKCIHVAGTNGKGSIASALAFILHKSGYKTGLYTSPHLICFNERISINNQLISDKNVVAAYEAVKKVRSGVREPTFFEYTTAMALYEFGKQHVDWAVIETGMGGRLDATNSIKPAVSIISNIAMEHQIYLGNTIAEIAGEKAGIIKRGVPIITGARQKKVITVLKEIADKKSAHFYRLGTDFKVRRSQKDTFSYYGIENIWQGMRTGLLGNHQVDNAALVIAACEILKNRGVKIPIEAIRDGLENNKWPGRLEVISTSPYVLIDGAHNPAAISNLANFLSNNLADRNITLVAGILDDKSYKSMLNRLLPFCSRVILTRPKIDRSLAPDRIYPIVKKMISEVTIIQDVAAAVSHAIATASADDVICITGSLYVVGEAKAVLGEGNGYSIAI